MTLLGLVVLLVVAGVAGSIGQGLAGYSRGGCLLSIILGFIGSLLGSWLARVLGLPILLPIQGLPVIWSIIGATIFVAVLGALTPRRRDRSVQGRRR